MNRQELSSDREGFFRISSAALLILRAFKPALFRGKNESENLRLIEERKSPRKGKSPSSRFSLRSWKPDRRYDTADTLCHRSKDRYLLHAALILLFFLFPVISGATLEYDLNGNLVSGDGFYRKYNSLNQLWKVYSGNNDSGALLITYAHHPTENRVYVKNISNPDGSWKETVYYISNEMQRKVNHTGTFDSFLVFHDGILISAVLENRTDYYLTDHLGSAVSVVSQQSLQSKENLSFGPFGEGSFGEPEFRRYTGKEFEEEIGDYDYGARKYKAEWIRFLEPDPILSNPYNPQKLNPYSYALNNPYSYVDPDGKDVYLAERRLQDPVISRTPGSHTFLRIVPDHPEDFSGDYEGFGQEFTLGGIKEGSSLVIVRDDSADRDPGKLLRGETLLPVPGDKDTEIIKMLIDLYRDYDLDKDKVTYFVFPSNSQKIGNSNTATTSLLEGANIPYEDVRIKAFAPGFGQIKTKISQLGQNYRRNVMVDPLTGTLSYTNVYDRTTKLCKQCSIKAG